MDPASNSLAVLLRYPASQSPQPVEDFQPKRRIEVSAGATPSGIGVALTDAGNLAKWEHLPNLREVSGIHLRAIHSSSGPRGKSYALRFGANYCTSDYQEILSDPAVHVVVVVSRNPQPAPQLWQRYERASTCLQRNRWH